MALPPIQNGPIPPATGSARPAGRLPEAFAQRLAALGIESPAARLTGQTAAPRAASVPQDAPAAAPSTAFGVQPAAANATPAARPDTLARPGRVLDIKV